MIILGIETSCDETAISIVEAEGDLNSLKFRVLGSAVHSQIEMHREFGGVVPNLAKREHKINLPIVYRQAFEKAGISEDKIEIIAVTVGPGLEPALWVGINFAEELGKRLNVAVVGANHMEGHIASVLFNKTDELKSKKLKVKSGVKFPSVALLISGGHTELIFMKNWVEKEKIGETKDDAVGEAFDKVARMLDLPYPGGPEISKLAEEARIKNINLEIKFPRPMIHSKDFNFSFSGLKTAVLYYLRKLQKKTEAISRLQKLAVAREFEDAVVETLVSKVKSAIEKHHPKTLIIGGGVIANKALRKNFLDLNGYYKNLDILIPEKPLTTDNAVMIAAAGFIEYRRNDNLSDKLAADGNLDIK